jgi:hypothetical protein
MDFIHIWYLGWPWSDMCILYRFHGWLIFARIIALFIFVWPYSPRQMTSCVHKMCGRTYGQTNMQRAITLAKSTIREIGICACSDHCQSIYQIWITCDKRQMTSCVHKMCEHTYGQTNMKRAITLAKINHPWNWSGHSSFVAFYSYLASWLAMIWICIYYTDFTDG